MITGIKGQLGSELNRILKPKEHEDMIIHCAWNFLDKSTEAQIECIKYTEDLLQEAFMTNKRFVFISTKTRIDSPYLRAKRLIEKVIKDLRLNYIIIKLPNLIGLGAVDKLGKGEHPFGRNIELMTIEDAAQKIKKAIKKDKKRTINFQGRFVSDILLRDLMVYARRKYET